MPYHTIINPPARVLILIAFSLILLTACGSTTTSQTSTAVIDPPETVTPDLSPVTPDPASLYPSCTISADLPNEPHVAICATALTMQVGQQISISAKSVDIGQVVFSLLANTADDNRAEIAVRVEMDGSYSIEETEAAPFTLIAVWRDRSDITFVIETSQPGTVTLSVSANGEIRETDPNGNDVFSWSSAVSETLTFTVTE